MKRGRRATTNVLTAQPGSKVTDFETALFLKLISFINSSIGIY